MHSLNLGFALWAAGSCIHVLLGTGRWGDHHSDDRTKLHRAWLELNDWSKNMKIQFLVSI